MGMTREQEEALKEWKRPLVKTLKAIAEVLLSDLLVSGVIDSDEQEVMCATLKQDTVQKVLSCLVNKDDGWKFLIAFLYGHKYTSIAQDLQRSANETVVPVHFDQLEVNYYKKFIAKVKDFYKADFGLTMLPDRSCRHVSRTWLDLQLAKRSDWLSSSSLYPEPIGKQELVQVLNRLTPHVVAVHGPPGSGKSTLVKKIAYDWASEIQAQRLDKTFDVVLAVSASMFPQNRSFLNFAVSELCHQVEFHIEPDYLIYTMKEKNCNVLVCIDPSTGVLSQQPDILLSFQTAVRNGMRLKLLVTTQNTALLPHTDELGLVVHDYDLWPLSEHVIQHLINVYCPSMRQAQLVRSVWSGLQHHLYAKVTPFVISFLCGKMSTEDGRRDLLELLQFLWKKGRHELSRWCVASVQDSITYAPQKQGHIFASNGYYNYLQIQENTWAYCLFDMGTSTVGLSSRLTKDAAALLYVVVVEESALPLLTIKLRQYVGRPIIVTCGSDHLSIASVSDITQCLNTIATTQQQGILKTKKSTSHKSTNKVVGNETKKVPATVKTTNKCSSNRKANQMGLVQSAFDWIAEAERMEASNPLGVCRNSPWGPCAICRSNLVKLGGKFGLSCLRKCFPAFRNRTSNAQS